MIQHGQLIVFEGSEAVGKSSLIKEASKALTQDGIAHIITREPGGSALGEAICNVIFKSMPAPSPMTELLLMFASRRDHIERIIAPALKAGQHVLCDRYIDSSYVYQSLTDEVTPQMIDQLVVDYVAPYLPDLCLVIDCPPEHSMKRITARGVMNEKDKGDLAYFTTLRKKFLARMQAHHTYPYILIDNHTFSLAKQKLIDLIRAL